MKKFFCIVVVILGFIVFSLCAEDNNTILIHSIFSRIDEENFQIVLKLEEQGEIVVNGKDYFTQNPKQLANLELEKKYGFWLYLETGKICLARIDETDLTDTYDEKKELTYLKKLSSNQYNAEDFAFIGDKYFYPKDFKLDSLENVMLITSRKDFSEGYYISNVTAVAQYGDAIYFKGKTKSKVMSIHGFGNTVPKERVKIYYKAEKDLESKYVEWTVVAIKKM